MNALAELIDLSKNLKNRSVEGWREKDGRVVGFLCNHVPEEILYAAGALPYRISPSGCTETGDADAYLSRLNCTFCRSCLQYAMDGKFDFLDGLVAVNPCDHMRRLWDVWRLKVGCSFTHMLSLPHRVSEGAERWYRDELDFLREGLQKAFGTKITDAKLKDAVQVHNTTKGLLKSLYELRANDAPPLTGSEVMRVLGAVLQTPKDQCNPLLSRLLDELQEREGVCNYTARLMVIGGACDSPDFIEVIEDLGGLVVADTLCFGSRYFWEPVKLEDDVMLSLARSYLHQPPCAGMVGAERMRLDYVLAMAKQFRVDGIVFQKLRWCDLWGGEVLYFAESLKKLGVPFLVLEREYWLSGLEQLKTRIQAFLEMVA